MENFNAKEYEEKLRIKYKIKKEFRDQELNEQANGIGGIIFILVILLALFYKCSHP